MKNEPRLGRAGVESTFQVPLIALLRSFAKDSAGIRFGVLLCGMALELLLRALSCIVRLAITGIFIAVASGKIQPGISAIGSWLWRQL